MQITRGKQPGAQKVVLYGPEGIGKSTFASKFPEPVFIDTEGSTRHMDVARLPKPSSWTMLLDDVKYIRDTPGVCGTLIIDTLDWAEALCTQHVCDTAQKKGVEEQEIRLAVSQKGYYPEDTPIENYDPAFISGVLVGAWNQVFAMVMSNRDLPF